MWQQPTIEYVVPFYRITTTFVRHRAILYVRESWNTSILVIISNTTSSEFNKP